MTKEECLSALAGTPDVRRTGRNRWTDGTYTFRVLQVEEGRKVVAEQIMPARDVNEAVRSAFRPLFLARQA